MEICKHYITGKCTRTPCRFQHVENVCFHYYVKGHCKFGNQCSKQHLESNKKKKNTESFQPSHQPSDMRVVFVDSNETIHYETYRANDVFVVTHLFPDITYDILRNELEDEVLTLWHGDTHMIANDKQPWKRYSPYFQKVVERMKHYFNIDVKSTRFNLYRDGSDWKPFHHDAAAIDAEKAMTQNVTIGVSFGRTRSACFEHATTRSKVEFSLGDGTVYGFGSQLNKDWRHGITQLTPEEREMDDRGRISIILWGWVKE